MDVFFEGLPSLQKEKGMMKTVVEGTFDLLTVFLLSDELSAEMTLSQRMNSFF